MDNSIRIPHIEGDRHCIDDVCLMILDRCRVDSRFVKSDRKTIRDSVLCDVVTVVGITCDFHLQFLRDDFFIRTERLIRYGRRFTNIQIEGRGIDFDFFRVVRSVNGKDNIRRSSVWAGIAGYCKDGSSRGRQIRAKQRCEGRIRRCSVFAVYRIIFDKFRGGRSAFPVDRPLQFVICLGHSPHCSVRGRNVGNQHFIVAVKESGVIDVRSFKSQFVFNMNCKCGGYVGAIICGRLDDGVAIIDGGNDTAGIDGSNIGSRRSP